MTQTYNDSKYADTNVAVVDERPMAVAVAAPAPALRTATRWATKGGLAILDQALISGSNFLVGIFLARWLMPEQYGAYALAFSVSLLLTFLYQALLLEPMAVFSGSAYRKSLRGYLSALLWIHVWLTGPGLLVMAAATFVAYKRGSANGLPGALLGITLAAPCILLFSLARRAYYMKLAPARAVVGAFLYCVIVNGGLFIVYRRGWMSPFSAFALMAIGALFTSIYLLFHVRGTLTEEVPGPTLNQTWSRHWDYGRWALATSAATWIPYYMYYPLLSWWFKDLVQTGQLRALMNLALPLEQSFTALSCLFLPYAARLHGEGGTAAAKKLTRNIAILYIGGAGLYWLAVIPMKARVFHLLYSGKYMEVSYLLPYVAVETILWSAAFGPTIVLRGMESPNSVFYARCAASILSLAVGVPLTLIYGLWGCVLGIVFSNAAALLFAVVILRKKIALGDAALIETRASAS
jgi:O-antigen/teichoic acid export membrane protein